MAKAIWNGMTIADSDDTIIVEGNHYFPRSSIRAEFFSDSEKTSRCGWKGTANYLDIEVNGKKNPAAAWYYADPLPKAERIRGRVAFWNGVETSD